MRIELDLTHREAEMLREVAISSVERMMHPDEKSAIIKLNDALDKALIARSTVPATHPVRMSPTAGQRPDCWLAQFSGRPCDGKLDKAHLLPKQMLKREISKEPGFIWHPMIWRYACRRHHNDLDFGNLRLTREQIPASVETFAKKFPVLLPKLDRLYGTRSYTADMHGSDMQAARDGYAP